MRCGRRHIARHAATVLLMHTSLAPVCELSSLTSSTIFLKSWLYHDHIRAVFTSCLADIKTAAVLYLNGQSTHCMSARRSLWALASFAKYDSVPSSPAAEPGLGASHRSSTARLKRSMSRSVTSHRLATAAGQPAVERTVLVRSQGPLWVADR